MRKSILLAVVLLVSWVALVPGTARADGAANVVLVDTIVIHGERHMPQVLLLLKRATFDFKLPPLQHDSLPLVVHSVEDVD